MKARKTIDDFGILPINVDFIFQARTVIKDLMSR